MRYLYDMFQDIHTYIYVYIYIYLYAYAGWWFQTFFIFHHIWDVILPIDFHICQDV